MNAQPPIMKRCAACGADVPFTARQCPNCKGIFPIMPSQTSPWPALISMVIVLLIIFWCLGICSGMFTPNKKETTVTPTTPVTTPAVKDNNIHVVPTPVSQEPPVDPIRGPKPSARSFDGECPIIDKFLKANINDYNSVRVVEVSPVKEWGSDAWAQRVKFRANNAFGGTILKEWLFVMKNDQVINVIDLQN